MKNLEHALAPGTELPGYRIDKAIGGGGFSVVYLAEELATGEHVVIKEYLPDSQAQRRPDARVEPVSEDAAPVFRLGIKRFFDEASALARIQHPNIVQVRNIFRANDTVYMVMRYEDGHDLRWYIKHKEGRLSERFMRTVFPRLLLGLRELHQNRILHLDIKPANIFVRKGGQPLLLDFGATRESHIGGRHQGPFTLTAGFAPLEQHRGGHIGPWTDLYAIGATMYTCMGGKPPPPATERAIKDTLKPAVRAFGRHYSDILCEAVDWCLQMDQTHRPQSAQALLDALNPLLRETPEVPEETGPFARLVARLTGK